MSNTNRFSCEIIADANKTTTGWRGDTTSQYGGWH